MDKSSLRPIIKNIELRNFRCFEEKKISLDAPIVIIEGDNGSGKSSVLEALYFAGHMRSCKTAYVEHLIKQKEEAFFLKVQTSSLDILYIGVQKKKKIIKVNQKQLKSLKEVRSLLTVIGIVDTDMLLVQGGPLERRLFLDEALILLHADLMVLFKNLKTTIKQRNDFLQRGIQNETLYAVLTEQLVQYSALVQRNRFELLVKLSLSINQLIKEYALPITILSLKYMPKIDCTQSSILEYVNSYEQREYAYGKTLFGAHLDDFVIYWETMDVRKHSSRGQQKLVVMLLKIGLAKLCNASNKEILLLIDDFMTDFDHQNMNRMMLILSSIEGQLIYTSPLPLFLQRYVPLSVEKVTITL
jgi:DNA replication and repair protein RecF